MPTPAERIYDAAAAVLGAQQARADQITNLIAPIGAGAAAAALLLKPALHDISHAKVAQVVGFVAGGVGLILVLFAGVLVLIGVKIKGVEAADLVGVAAGPPDLLDDPKTFDLEAATKLAAPRKENEDALRKLRRLFSVVTLGLLLEVGGLAVAAEIQPHAKAKPPKKASVSGVGRDAPTLRLRTAWLWGGVVTLGGQLAPKSLSRVSVVITLHGRGAQTVSRTAPLRDGHFRVRIAAKPGLRPVRSASYMITWTAPPRATKARLSGSVSPRRNH